MLFEENLQTDDETPDEIKRATEIIDFERNNIAKNKNYINEQNELEQWLENYYNVDRPIHFIEVPTMNYHNCNYYWFEGSTKKVKWTNDYIKWAEDVKEQLLNKEVDIPPESITCFHLHLEVFISYAQRDCDNVVKPFIDRLFKYYGRDDNQNKVWTGAIKKVDEKKDEGYMFKIEGMSERQYLKSKLSAQYERQQEQNKRSRRLRP